MPGSLPGLLKRKGVLSVGVVAATLVAAFTLGQTQAAGSKSMRVQAPAQFKEGEVVVKLKKPLGVQSLGAVAHNLLMSLGKLHSVSLNPLMTDKSIYRIKANDKVAMGQLIRDIQANSAVELAEPNYIYHTMDMPSDPVKAVLPNDPNFGLNWGLLNIGQKDSKGQDGLAGSDIGATKAWATGTGSKDILVAVIDTGVDYNHPDLKNNIFINTKEDPSNGKDNDGNGFINDYHGWNFEGKNNNPMDDNKHGTHTSGTIGAEGGNGEGTAGVNWHVSILPIKFLSAAGSGSLDDAVESINYATLMNVKIMSNSWGGGGFSQTMFDAIKKAKDKGILFVAAAGNDGKDNDATASYPASYDSDNVIAVAATTVDPVRNLRKKTITGGRLNIYNAINNIIPERKEPPADRWKAMAHAVESAHPYVSNTTQTFEISHPGAKFIRVHFSKVGTEAGYDLIRIKDGAGTVAEELSGEQADYTTDYVEGDKATVTFTSDGSVDGWGFAIDHYDFID
ncbi:MAG: S8 family serine peptidase [Deltaproteobacteria bacterium]|nr:S8 family serine peptidase [Deltaproteobacteria bacterium]